MRQDAEKELALMSQHGTTMISGTSMQSREEGKNKAFCHQRRPNKERNHNHKDDELPTDEQNKLRKENKTIHYANRGDEHIE
jgi:hypothetical protein